MRLGNTEGWNCGEPGTAIRWWPGVCLIRLQGGIFAVIRGFQRWSRVN